MKKEIIIYLPQNYADWEVSYLSSELNKPERDFTIKTLAKTEDPVISMGGFTVLPDYTLHTLPAEFHMLILTGGTTWLSGENDCIKELLDTCVQKDIPIAAICNACTFLAENGYLNATAHTGNSLPYLQEFAPHYKGADHFIENPAVSSPKLITANGLSAVEFAIEVFKYFNIMTENELANFHKMFKFGIFTG